MNPSRKVVSVHAAAETVRRAQREGRTVVLCHGCFDIVHPGHLRHLTWARRQGDMLVVSVSGDAAVRKGVGRPLVPEALRAENLAALECVDLVIVTPEATAVRTLRAVRPDRYVKGAEYRDSHDPRLAAEREAVEEGGGQVLFSAGDVVYSSTSLIASRADGWSLDAERAAGYVRRHNASFGALRAMLRRAGRLRCLVVGDTIIDEYIHCDATHVAGEAPVLNATMVRTERFMGASAIAAQHLRALGAQVTLATAVGAGKGSDRLRTTCAEEGIGLIELPHRARIARKRRYLAKKSKLLKLDDPPPAAFGARETEDFLAQIDGAAEHWDLVALLDFGYGTLAAGSLPRLLETLRPRAGVMVGDVSGPRADLLALRGCDLLAPTEPELRTAMRAPSVGLATLAGSLAGQTGAGGVIVKLGEDGLVAFDAHGRDDEGRLTSDFLPSLARRAADPLGCGDALLAAAGVTLAAGGSLFDAALVGSAAAGLEAETHGNHPIVLERVLERLESVCSLAAETAPERPADATAVA